MKGQCVNGLDLDLFHSINCFSSDKSVTKLAAGLTKISSCRQNFYLHDEIMDLKKKKKNKPDLLFISMHQFFK